MKAERGRGLPSTPSLTSALDSCGWELPARAASPPGKTEYPLHRRLIGPQGLSARVRKISPPPGLDLRTVQPVSSSYADWAIPGHSKERYTKTCHKPQVVKTSTGFVTLREIILSPSIITICPKTFSSRVWQSLLMASRKYIQWYISYLTLWPWSWTFTV